jgi:small subunit ribosomal protein S6
VNKYELGAIIKPGLEDEAYKAELERLQGFVQRFGGVIDKIDEWGRRKLAYPINKITEGNYVFIYFTAPPEAPAEIEGRIRIAENIMRFLLVAI